VLNIYNKYEMETHHNLNVNVVLVDKNDNEIGVMPKLEAHQKGVLHRAFSVFVFNSDGKILMQQRADGKYHSAGLWSNTCCSHPLPGESNNDAANRRLMQEMGITCTLTPIFSFIYKAELENDLIEHEFDHVFFGNFEGVPNINTDEVQNYKYMSLAELELDITIHPQNYTEWLKLCIEGVRTYYEYSKLETNLQF
jgi:isopentenyl-diphosphate Delta-isomerase